MTHYSPFSKPINSLLADDLKALRFTAEGWYVEYKREASKAEAIAKSVSAFANTHGGWLFYGVAEKSKEDSVAGSFPGIARADVDSALQRLRQAVAVSINPSPHYETRVVWGPSLELELAADHAVICIYVPRGPNSPYIHKTGQIYRRVADGSEPKAENDRFVLDQLWRRSDALVADYEKWVNRDPELSKGEGEKPYIRLLMVADRWRDREGWLDISLQKVRELLAAKHPTATSMQFDNVYTSANGFVARQLMGSDPQNLGLTLKLSRNLSSELILPLNLYTPTSLEYLRSSLKGYTYGDKFCDVLHNKGYRNPRVVDLNFLLAVTSAMATLQHEIFKLANWSHGFYCKAVLINVWRTLPFLDAPTLIYEFDKHGIPMLLNSRVISGFSTHPDSFVKVEAYEDRPEDEKVALQGFDMFYPIAEAYGIPTSLPDDNGNNSKLIGELVNTAANATRAQSARNHQDRCD